MRVAVVLEQALAPVPGGVGRYARELAAALAAQAGPGDGVAGWVAWHRDSAAAVVAGVAGPRRLALARRPLIAAWERGLGPVPRGADVVHAPSLLVPPRGRHRIVTIHDAVPWTQPETLTPRGVRWHRIMAERVVRSDVVVTVPTTAVAEELLAVLPGLARDRVHVLGGGVAEVFRSAPDPARLAAVRERYALPDRFVLTLATLEPRKGLDTLVAARARLPEPAPPVVVVGASGWGGVNLPGFAAAAGLADGAIRVLGPVPDPDLAAILSAASVLAVPSRAEGFGLPVAEAMAAGTAVVCTDVPALIEVAGGAARVVPVDDPAALATALSAVLDDETEQARLVAAGRLRAPAHSWTAVGARAWTLYRRLVEGG